MSEHHRVVMEFYRELLKKYMKLVLNEEGVTFLDMPWMEGTGLTEIDLKALRAIESELENADV